MRGFRSALLAAAAAPVLIASASAATRTWQNPAANSTFNTPGNWSSATAPVGGDTAVFNASDITVINFTANQDLAAMTFNNGSSDYTFGFTGAYDLNFTGAGVARNAGAGSVQFNVNVVDADIQFFNSASASGGVSPVSYAVSNGGEMGFFNSSKGGNAILQAGPNGRIYFYSSSDAQNAVITVQDAASAELRVQDSATLGSATVVNNNLVNFFNSSKAGSANITNNDTLNFNNSSSAQSSTVTTNNGATTAFNDTSLGGTSRQILNGTGILDISPHAAGTLTFGAVESGSASSQFKLGGNSADVGSLGLNGTFAGVISGTGAINKVGSGTWNLTNTNTYSGGTTITGGVLAVNGNGALGATTGGLTMKGGTLRALASFTLDRNTTLDTAGGVFDTQQYTITSGSTNTISGSGFLEKTGTGRLIFLGDKTYTGDTNVLNGTLQLGNGVTSGNITGAGTVFLVNDVNGKGTLLFNPGANLTFVRNILGGGDISVQGTKTVTLDPSAGTGNNNHTGLTKINDSARLVAVGGNAIGDKSVVVLSDSGVFEITSGEVIGGLSGSSSANPNVVLGNNELTLAGNEWQTAQSFTGVIAGNNGSIVKTGTYIQTLNGDNTFNGGTAVNEGTLLVNGSLVNDVTVNPGATFGGNANVNGDLFSTSGNISPGNSPGIITNSGDYIASGSPTLSVDVFANQVNAPVNGTTHDFFSIGDDIVGVNTQILLDFSANSDAPVATTGNGIEIVRVGGTSQTDDFFLSTAVQTEQNGFIGGFQYLVNALQNSGPGGSDQVFLRTVVREELVANATILAAGRQLGRDCFRGPESTQNGDVKGNGRVWVNGRYGTFEADASTGADFDSDYYCVTGGIDVPVGEGFAVGVRGGYANQDLDLNIVQGTAKLDGDTWSVEGAVTYTGSGGYYSGLTAGYRSTDWDYDHALVSGGLSAATVDGMVGSLYAGYRHDLGSNAALSFEGAVLYDATDCDANCFLAGTKEKTSDWEGRLAVRYDAQWGAIKPYAMVSVTHNFDDGQKVYLGNAVSVVETASALAGVNLGLQADLGEGWALTAEASTTQGLDSDVAGYQGLIGIRKTW